MVVLAESGQQSWKVPVRMPIDETWGVAKVIEPRRSCCCAPALNKNDTPFMPKANLIASQPGVKSLIGLRFGRLVVFEDAGNKCGNRHFWRCRCDCGTIKDVRSSNLKTGTAKSCGCLKLEVSRSRIRHGLLKHGISHQVYNAWHNMVYRCSHPESSVGKDYAGRGIKVCKAWLHSPGAFARDMGPRPAGYSLDRIDNNGNYEPTNCRWTTRAVQNRNSRRNRFYTVRGITGCLKDLSRIFKVRDCTIVHRLDNLHWDVEKAFLTPTGRTSKPW
jgi:hypothetical protein